MERSLLLDTHVVVWWLMAPERLSRRSRIRIESGEACVSVISLWEMLQKHDRGQLKLPGGPLGPNIEAQGFRLLALRAEHVQAAAELGSLQGDPYDRMIVGTARADNMVLVTRDAHIIEHAGPLLGPLLLEA